MARPATKSSEDGTSFNHSTLRKLEDAFSDGMNNIQACLLAGVSESVFYDVCSRNPTLSERFRRLQETPKVHAIKNVVKAIRKGDMKISQWYLERRHNPEFAPQDASSESETKPRFSYSEEAKNRLKKYL